MSLSPNGARFLRLAEGRSLHPSRVEFIQDWIAGLNLPELNDAQYSAFFSLSYQAYYGECTTIDNALFKESDLVLFLQRGQFQLAAGEFDHWTVRDGRFDKDLIYRRRREWELFLHGKYNS